MVRWRGRRESSNVEDVRNRSGRAGGRGGFRFPFPGGLGGGNRRGRSRGRGLRIPVPGGRSRGGGGFSFWTILLVLGVCWFLGINPLKILLGGGGLPIPGIETTQAPRGNFDGNGSDITRDIPRLPGDPRSAPGSRDVAGDASRRRSAPTTPARGSEDELASFVKVILATTEDVWRLQFRQAGRAYEEPKLVLFRDSWPTGCGQGQAAMGPFYCPLDKTVYIDLSFYDQLRQMASLRGGLEQADFAMAYVVAHEVGHHVQTLLGITGKVQGKKFRIGKREANRLQVRMELQADCLAGVWAGVADRQMKMLERGDLQEGMKAAAGIGDDVIQRRAGRRVRPESFTHGSAEQRQRWLMNGYESGNMATCDTFRARRL
ncbi:MAG: neutral zinc metallopeptidase [Pseudomonadota bacterium]